MVRYWWRVFSRAFRDSCARLGHNLKKTFFGIIVVFVTLAIGVYLKGISQAFGEFEWTLHGILASLIVFALVFCYRLAVTPKILEDEAASSEREKADKLQAQIDKLRAEFAAHAESEREETATRDRQQEELKRENKRLRYSNPQHNALRGQLEQYLSLFESLKERIGQGDRTAGTELDKLDHEAHTYIKNNFPQDARFVADCPINFRYSHAKHVDLAEVRTRCQVRIDGLKNILKNFG